MKVTLEDIQAQIESEYFFTAAQAVEGNPDIGEDADALSRVTFCTIILKNKFVVVGVNEGPADPSEFDPELGKQYARKHAIDQIWSYLGFALKDKLHSEK